MREGKKTGIDGGTSNSIANVKAREREKIQSMIYVENKLRI